MLTSAAARSGRPGCQLSDIRCRFRPALHTLAGQRRLHAELPTGTTVGGATTHDFNLETSVLLAAAAFEAYLEPAERSGLADVAVNGTQTQYFCRGFVQSAFSGILKVTVLRGRNLRAADFTGRSDPYVTVSVGESSGTTSWKLQTLEPEWHESFNLWVPKDPARGPGVNGPPAGPLLRVDVRDKDFLSSDDDLGTAFVVFENLQPGAPQEVLVQLRGPNAEEGSIILELTHLPFTSRVAEVESLLDSVEEEGREAAVLEGQPVDPGAIVQSVGERLVEVAPPAEAESIQDAWSALAEVYKDSLLANTQRVAYIDNPETDTQAWVVRDEATKQVVVAFRGTEQVKWKDLVTDLNFVPADLNVEGVRDEQSILNKLLHRSSTPTVHNGFLEAWVSIRGRVLSIIDAATGGDPSWHVYLTGHSLGGALSTLAAFTLATRRKVRYKVTMYNFGSPRVGNKAFAEQYAAAVPDSFRVHNHADVIAAMPRLMGYCHVPHGVQIGEGGALRLLDEKGLDMLGEGRATLEVIQEIGGKWLDDLQRDMTLELVLDHEMKLLSTLTGGQALTQHMEDFYLEALCKQVQVQGGGKDVAHIIARVTEKLESFRAAAAADAGAGPPAEPAGDDAAADARHGDAVTGEQR